MKKTKQIPCKGIITLALGEITGHHHSIVLPKNSTAKLWETDVPGCTILETGNTDLELNHQEHGTITTIPKQAEIEVWIQEEYDGEALAKRRRVAD